MRLLLIEDEVGASDLLAERLVESGFRPTRVQSCIEAVGTASDSPVGAALIDQTKVSSVPAALVRQLRDGGILQPLIVLSPLSHWQDKVDALDAGADDYAVKPVRSDEVAARLRAVIRRSAGQARDRILIGDLDIDLRLRCAWKNGNCLSLSRSEFRLLRLLMLADCQPITREEIVATIAANGADLSANAVEVLVSRLRHKVGGEKIRTIRGVGYQLQSSGPIGILHPDRHDVCRQDLDNGTAAPEV